MITCIRAPRPLEKLVSLMLLALTFAAVLAACGGSSSTVAAPPTATPSPTPSRGNRQTLATYTDPQGQFTIKYIANWQVKTSMATIQNIPVNLTTFTPPNGKAQDVEIVATGGQGFSAQNLPDVLTQAGYTGYTRTNGPTSVTTKANNITWQVEQGTTMTSGKTANADGAFATHSTLNVIVTAASTNKTFQGNTPLFRALLDSFTFGTST